MISLQDIESAQARIAGQVRRTPVIRAAPLKQPITEAALWLKLENLQISGSFKARGAMNKLLSLSDDELKRGLVTASGGNHGLAVAYAGWLMKVPATVFLPHNTPPSKADQVRSWDARVIIEGAVWDDANRAALSFAGQTGATYIHPFEDPAVIAGQGTVGLEILADLPDVDAVLVAIGGGGLIVGVALAAKSLKPGIKVIGVEPAGAPTLYESLRAGQVITLTEIRTAANTLAPRRTSQINFDIIRDNVEKIVLVTDDEMRETARWLWRELGIGAELSSAAAVAALMSGRYRPEPAQVVCAVVCSAGTDGITPNS
jgi:threonine dehydratase